MNETRSYTGGCHCGKVRYQVETDLGRVIECNCSICTKAGYVMAFVPAGQFKLLSDGELPDYQFNKHAIHHLFCPTCGIHSFARGTAPGGQEMAAINVRCLDGVDLGALTTTKFDGRSL